MTSIRVLRWAVGAIIVSTGTVAPVRWSPEHGLISATACADGTCCFEQNSDCIINQVVTENAYRKTGPGSCKDPTQPAPPP